MTITLDTRIGTLAAEHPLATRVFARHGIDFCCGGGRPLGAVCAQKGLDGAAIIAEVQSEINKAGEQPTTWNDAPLNDLIDHIITTYHRPLREELPRLEAMARKVLDVHGPRDPERLERIVTVFAGLRAELESHMKKEEMILFPMIEQRSGPPTAAPISVMEAEHESAGNALHELRELTGDYVVPEEACNTWRALWAGLEALEADMHQHIHLENNILFPRALAGEYAARG